MLRSSAVAATVAAVAFDAAGTGGRRREKGGQNLMKPMPVRQTMDVLFFHHLHMNMQT